MTIVCVDIASLSIVNKYPGDVPNQSSWGGPMGDPSIITHIPCADLDADIVMAVRDETTGLVTLVEDPSKVAARTQRLWSDLRAERNRRLAACDWTQLGDAHMSQERKDAWAQYRQALRDLPDEVTDPTNVTWPLDPSVPVPVQSTGSRLDNLLSHADS